MNVLWCQQQEPAEVIDDALGIRCRGHAPRQAASNDLNELARVESGDAPVIAADPGRGRNRGVARGKILQAGITQARGHHPV